MIEVALFCLLFVCMCLFSIVPWHLLTLQLDNGLLDNHEHEQRIELNYNYDFASLFAWV